MYVLVKGPEPECVLRIIHGDDSDALVWSYIAQWGGQHSVYTVLQELVKSNFHSVPQCSSEEEINNYVKEVPVDKMYFISFDTMFGSQHIWKTVYELVSTDDKWGK